MEDETLGFIGKMHKTFFTKLFNKGMIKGIYMKNLKPLCNTYKPDNK
jgi:hypothetical protein